ncbi:MAG: methionyl aminopeptidase [Catonella sp.]|jgi:methionyl aminopeptidase|nr:methionyl aminopeptidase [Catonella sp.]MDY6355911.1 methionyl aminopeptidase [Catonella sp.]
MLFEKIGRNDPCWCGSGKKYKQCHEEFDNKIRAAKLRGHKVPTHKMIKTPEQIDGIREAGKVNNAVLDEVAAKIKLGMTTQEIDDIVSETTKKLGGICAPLNYEKFPKSVCTSINDQVCHGIPSTEDVLEDGDIVNVDCTTIYKGFYADASRMFCIGNVEPEDKKLVDDVKEMVNRGIKETKPWGYLGDIGQVINDYAKANGYSVVREIGGHGVGLEFHEDPWVSYVTRKGTDYLLAPGMVFTIEPMVNFGEPEVYVDEDNDWTVYTEDGSYSAQWEVTIAVTENGNEVLAW